MVRQVAKRLASLFCDEKIQIICVLGAPFVGKTWLVNHILESEKIGCAQVFDDINSYERFEEIIKNKSNCCGKVIIVGRLSESKCKGIIGNNLVVECETLYPMNFSEFRLAMPIGYHIHEREMLKIYMLVGGLPEVVKNFVQTGDIKIVRQKQRQLFDKIRSELEIKAQNVINEVIKQELSESTGFCIRQIDKNAREREYAQIIEELVNIGLIEKYERLVSVLDKGARKYRLKFFDIGIYSMINDLNIDNLSVNGDTWNRELLYDFYIKELRTYIDRNVEEIKYWKKNRAKAKMPIIIERDEVDKILISVLLYENVNCVSRSELSFIRDYPMTKSINIPIPTKDKVIDGQELYCKICNNT